ncbi:MAG: T9SS type A sorting domain-containing protein [Bacteroidetes bacterium]|nr:T9SS type A sorting domain-containing protein [Bacteroidota bacterium]
MIRSILIFVASLCLAHSVHGQRNTWVTQNPSNLAGVYHAVQMVTPTTMFAVGDVGTVAYSTDGGYTLLSKSLTTKSLLGVSFLDSLRGMCVGEAGVAFQTTDGGATWLPMNIGAGSNEPLHSVLMVDDSLAIACGGTSESGTIHISRDGGATWTLFAAELGIGIVKRVRMLRPDFIVLVGLNGSLYVTRNHAASFTKYLLPYQNDLNDVCFLDEQHIVAVGSPGRYMLGTSDGGTHWHALDSANFDLGSAQLNGVDANDLAHVVTVGDYGEILYSTNGGENWTRSFFGSLGGLKAISMYSALDGITVGQDGLIMRTSDGGVTWEFIPRRPEVRTLRAIRMMPDGQRGFAAGGYGTILYTVDSGHTWIPSATGVITGLNGAVLNEDGRGFVVGDFGTLLRTSDAGVTWSRVTLATSKTLHCIAEASKNTLYIGGDSALFLKSTDGGAYWTRYHGPLPDSFAITGMTFFDSLQGLVCSPFGVFKTTDAGISWHLVLSPIVCGFMKLSASSMMPNAIGVGLATGGQFTGAVGYSTDRGETWVCTELLQRSPFPPSDVFTPDGVHATFVGHYGLIYHSVDGGVTWSTQSAPTTNNLYGIVYGSTRAGWSCGIRGTILRIDTDEGLDVRNPDVIAMPHLTIERVYPNPAVSRVRLLYQLDQPGKANVQVFDQLGVRVLDAQLGMRANGEHTDELNLGELASGSYLLFLSVGNAAATTQIVVVK